MSRSLVAVAFLAAAFAIAVPAGAEPVPGMVDDAVLGQPCENTKSFVFGTNTSGAILACGSPKAPGEWSQIAGLVGVREIGTECFSDVVAVNPDGNGWTAAQSPDGLPLFCVYPTDTWEVHPTS
ncbi:hypothetical protein ACIA48_18295 [Mycobacterium sp. NPDC051804]|uniref:hypothetical protein n=1 Tax=Mycobacterium sp. NPDC051804 TaxID=3364295 RepID=UPI00379C0E78